jgi:hypothetical protein
MNPCRIRAAQLLVKIFIIGSVAVPAGFRAPGANTSLTYLGTLSRLANTRCGNASWQLGSA